MFFLVPIGHDEDKLLRFPYVTVAFMVACLLVQVWGTAVWINAYQTLSQGNFATDLDAQLAADNAMAWHPILRWGYATEDGSAWQLVTSAFVHAGWMHLIGNMILLYLTGCNVEDRWGHWQFGAFYLGGILAAVGAYALVHPADATVLVGASGAISACMAAFLVLYWGSQIRFAWALIPFGAGTFDAPAWIALVLWFLLQLVNLGFETGGVATVAYSAHVGGFVFGLVTALAIKYSGVQSRMDHRREAATTVFEEDPEFVAAFAQIERDPGGAARGFAMVLAREPRHEGALRELAQLEDVAAREGDPAITVAVHRALLGAALGGRDGAEAVRRFRALVEQRATSDLDERALADLITAGAEHGDAATVVHATRALLIDHPASRILPRAMFESARAQLSAGQPALAGKTLASLLKRFPHDAFAERARAELAAEIQLQTARSSAGANAPASTSN